jgi:hypothetical protein
MRLRQNYLDAIEAAGGCLSPCRTSPTGSATISSGSNAWW